MRVTFLASWARELAFITWPNYINTVAGPVKISKIFKTLKLSNVVKWFLLLLYFNVLIFERFYEF